MASAARIPFSAREETIIRGLNTWMTFIGVVHLLVTLFLLTCGGFGVLRAIGLFGTATAGGIVLGLQMVLVVLGAFFSLAEGVLLVQARMALSAVLTSDREDQALVSTAIRRLKLFFMTEVGFFVLGALVSILGVVLNFVAPEAGGSASGQEIIEAIRRARGGQ